MDIQHVVLCLFLENRKKIQNLIRRRILRSISLQTNSPGARKFCFRTMRHQLHDNTLLIARFSILHKNHTRTYTGQVFFQHLIRENESQQSPVSTYVLIIAGISSPTALSCPRVSCYLSRTVNTSIYELNTRAYWSIPHYCSYVDDIVQRAKINRFQ